MCASRAGLGCVMGARDLPNPYSGLFKRGGMPQIGPNRDLGDHVRLSDVAGVRYEWGGGRRAIYQIPIRAYSGAGVCPE